LKYRSRKARKDAAVVERMTELSAQYPRYGYRRIRIFLDRDGHAIALAGAPAVADGAATGTAQAAEEARRCRRAATPASAERTEPSVVLRLRFRPLRQRSTAQVPDRDRRVHQRRLGDRRRRPHPLVSSPDSAGLLFSLCTRQHPVAPTIGFHPVVTLSSSAGQPGLKS
jgi:hypothetical protein